MKNKTATVLTALIALFLVVYAGYQIWDFFYSPYTTEIVSSYSLQETMHVSGIAVRNETVIESESGESVSYVYGDASKVNKNKVVAYAHASSDTVDKIEKAKQLEEKIASLEEASNNVAQLYGSYEYINKEIGDSVIDYVALATSGNLSDLGQSRDNLLRDINRKTSLTGEDNNFEERISLLKADYANLTEEIEADQTETVLSPKTGYFISEIDGFEEIINKDNLFEMSVSEIEDIINNGIVQNESGVGKIADSYKWYYVFMVPSDKADIFKNKSKVTVRFEGISDDYTLNVESIIEDESSENCAVVLLCKRFTSEVASIRLCDADIVLESYDGLKISNQSLRFDEDQNIGVFILEKEEVKFRYVDILYQTSTYSIVATNEGKNRYLQRFDEVFVGGNDLYAGKIID